MESVNNAIRGFQNYWVLCKTYVRISQAVLCARVLTLIPRSVAMTTNPGDNIGPKAPTTEADRPTMRRTASYFHIDHSFPVSIRFKRRLNVTYIQWIVWGVRRLRHEDDMWVSPCTMFPLVSRNRLVFPWNIGLVIHTSFFLSALYTLGTSPWELTCTRNKLHMLVVKQTKRYLDGFAPLDDGTERFCAGLGNVK